MASSEEHRRRRVRALSILMAIAFAAMFTALGLALAQHNLWLVT